MASSTSKSISESKPSSSSELKKLQDQAKKELTLQNVFNLAEWHFKRDQFQEAKIQFDKVIELANTPLPPSLTSEEQDREKSYRKFKKGQAYYRLGEMCEYGSADFPNDVMHLGTWNDNSRCYHYYSKASALGIIQANVAMILVFMKTLNKEYGLGHYGLAWCDTRISQTLDVIASDPDLQNSSVTQYQLGCICEIIVDRLGNSYGLMGRYNELYQGWKGYSRLDELSKSSALKHYREAGAYPKALCKIAEHNLKSLSEKTNPDRFYRILDILRSAGNFSEYSLERRIVHAKLTDILRILEKNPLQNRDVIFQAKYDLAVLAFSDAVSKEDQIELIKSAIYLLLLASDNYSAFCTSLIKESSSRREMILDAIYRLPEYMGKRFGSASIADVKERKTHLSSLDKLGGILSIIDNILDYSDRNEFLCTSLEMEISKLRALEMGAEKKSTASVGIFSPPAISKEQSVDQRIINSITFLTSQIALAEKQYEKLKNKAEQEKNIECRKKCNDILKKYVPINMMLEVHEPKKFTSLEEVTRDDAQKYLADMHMVCHLQLSGSDIQALPEWRKNIDALSARLNSYAAKTIASERKEILGESKRSDINDNAIEDLKQVLLEIIRLKQNAILSLTNMPTTRPSTSLSSVPTSASSSFSGSTPLPTSSPSSLSSAPPTTSSSLASGLVFTATTTSLCSVPTSASSSSSGGSLIPSSNPASLFSAFIDACDEMLNVVPKELLNKIQHTDSTFVQFGLTLKR